MQALRLVALLCALVASALAQAPHLRHLPPELPWDGKSRELLLPADAPWATPFEKSGGRESPTHAETSAWLRRLAKASPMVSYRSLGTSPQGREIPLIVAAADGAADPEALRASGKPLLFVQAGIHSGEIDGKDAGMMLLRDLCLFGRRPELLQRANLVFLPILNVDGHERRSPFGRINQRGPRELGWRTNARNLNLNRDYAKADAKEMQLLLGALRSYRPELYLDLHVTDGIDYQYDITFGACGTNGHSPAIGRWLNGSLFPALRASLEAGGHVPGPLIFPVDNRDLSKGIVDWLPSPRFSNGYGDLAHLPTVLLENHSLKRFDRRVLGTYLFVATCLDLVGREAKTLRSAIAEDQKRRPASVPLSFGARPAPHPTITYRGITAKQRSSEVSGGEVTEWLGEPIIQTIPLIPLDRPTRSAERPVAYWIPAQYTEVIERLRLHGIAHEITERAHTLELERDRIPDAHLDSKPFEGRVRVLGTPTSFTRRETWPKGSVRVPTDQPLGDLAIHLLEPGAPDSFWQWGFFPGSLQRTEYCEDYVIEPMARAMLEGDPELRKRFEAKLKADSEFRFDPQARLRWFYEQTPYHDAQHLLYPIARERAASKPKTPANPPRDEGATAASKSAKNRAPEAFDLSAKAEAIRKKHGLPALAGAIASGRDGILGRAVSGVRALGRDEAARFEDSWHLGSCTKALTATLVARLVEKKILRFDLSLGEVYGEELGDALHPHWKTITLLQLLSHRAGVIRDPNAGQREFMKREKTPRAQRRVLAELILKAPPRYEGPPAHHYSNAGYMLVGAVMEKLCDRSWFELLKAEVYEPLGMKHASCGPPGSAKRIDQPRGHARLGRFFPLRPREPGPGADNPAFYGPAGTACMPLRDWSLFLREHLEGARGESRFLAKSSWETLHRPVGSGTYALGWGCAERGWAKGRVLTHTGSNTMWSAVVWMAPERDLAIFATANAAVPESWKALDEMVSELLRKHDQR